MSEKLVITQVGQDEAELTAAVREFLLAPWEAGELTKVSLNTIIRRTGPGEIDSVVAGTHRKIPLAAFGACRRSLPQQWRGQRSPRP